MKIQWSAHHDFASQLASVAGKSLVGVLEAGWDYGYDLAGNMSSVQSVTASGQPALVTRRGHNALNQNCRRLVGSLDRSEATCPEGVRPAAGRSNQFKYNALGQRSQRIEKTGTTTTAHHYYLYDGIRLLCRYTGGTASTNLDRRYFNEGEQRKNGAAWDGFYYTRDHLGSIREVLSSNGTLVARYDYDPYGKRTAQYEASGYACDLGYTGHIIQPSPVTGQTELVMTLFRAYDPELGRWLSADPIGEEGGVNLYGYANLNPLEFIDLFGLEGEKTDNSSGFFAWLQRLLGLGKKATGNCASGKPWYGGSPPSSIGSGITKAGGSVIGPAIKIAEAGPDIYEMADKVAGHQQMLKAMDDYCASDREDTSEVKALDSSGNGPGIWKKK